MRTKLELGYLFVPLFIAFIIFLAAAAIFADYIIARTVILVLFLVIVAGAILIGLITFLRS